MTLEEVKDEDTPKVKVPLQVIQVKLAKKEDLLELEVKILQSPMGKMPAGSVYVSDPIEQFLVAGGDNDSIVIAKESQGLRSIYPTINGVEEVESVVDGGSQIISMALDVAMTLGVSWDPGYTINLQSANKGVDQTLGLTRNVPFLFGEATVYLQVHIVRDPAYKVLLGRPFDALMESQVQNFADGGQVITVTDLNTGKQCTVPTHKRGKPCRRENSISSSGFSVNLDDLVNDEGELALSIGLDEKGNPVQVCGYGNPQRGNKFTSEEKRDLFLAASLNEEKTHNDEGKLMLNAYLTD